MKTFEEAKASYMSIHKDYIKKQNENLDLINAKPNLRDCATNEERIKLSNEWHDKCKQLDVLCEELKIILAITRHNVYVTFWNEYYPKIKAIWDKYAGKKHGEKTAEKIRNEIKQTTGVWFYEYSRYSYPTINIEFGELMDEYNRNFIIEITQYDNDVKHGNGFIRHNDNTITEMNIATPHKCEEYIENPIMYMVDVKGKYNEISRKATELFAMADAFNHDTIHGFKPVIFSRPFLGGLEIEID